MNVVDKVVNFFNPQAGLARERARQANDIMVKRKFDAASYAKNNANWYRPSTTAAQEVSTANKKLSATGQELVRNNPLAQRVKHLWGDNLIGDGVKLSVVSKNKAQKKNFTESFDSWANSVDCDFEGHNTFAGLCWLWVVTMVETGGVLIRKHVNNTKNTVQLQTLEQTYLDAAKNGQIESTGSYILDGIQYDSMGQIQGYWILEHLGNLPYKTGTAPSKFHSADTIIHMYRKDRAGQHLGVTWFHSVANLLHNLDILHEAKLTQQQIAACFGAIITEADSNLGVGSDSPLLDSIEPAMIEYVKAGTEITQLTPPKADNSVEFELSIKRLIAVGTGVTYEALTGDFSKVNHASGRMGKAEFNNSLDRVQQSIVKVALDRVVGEWFVFDYELRGNRAVSGLSLDWTFPARQMVNPQEDQQVIIDRVRAGLMSPSKAAKMLEVDFEQVLNQWRIDKDLIEKHGLKFDLDPEYFAKTGNQLDDNDAAAANTNNDDDSDRSFDELADALTKMIDNEQG